MYHRPVVSREVYLQIARLLGGDVFEQRFGPPQTAEPDLDAFRALVDERLDRIAAALVEEAAASDDVIDRASANASLDDRLRTLAEVIDDAQAGRVRAAFGELTREW